MSTRGAGAFLSRPPGGPPRQAMLLAALDILDADQAEDAAEAASPVFSSEGLAADTDVEENAAGDEPEAWDDGASPETEGEKAC